MDQHNHPAANSGAVNDQASIRKLIEISGVIQLMRGCVIAPNYGVSSDLVAPLALSPLGVEMRDKLKLRHKRTRPNEAVLAVALAVGVGDGLLIDPQRTDLDALRAAMSIEVKRKRFLFPDPYRREFAEELFVTHEFRSTIGSADSVRFLRDKEQGVYQVGRSIVGPWGCIESDQVRALAPDRQIYGFYCESGWCSKLHEFQFETSQNAPINRALSDLRSILQEHNPETGNHLLRTYQLESAKLLLADPLVDSEQILNLVGDALTDQERIELAVIALSNQLKIEPAWRSRVATASSRVLSNPLDFARELSFGETMQLLHMFSNDVLVRAIDEAIVSKRIASESDLRRMPRVDRWPNKTMSAEIGTRGLRFSIPSDRENVILGQLLHRVYSSSPEDLAFALDRPNTEGLDSLISFAFQNMDVETVTDKCLVNDRRAAAIACRLLHLDESNKTRAEIGDLLKWRLGISNEVVASRVTGILAAIDSYLTADPARDESEKRGDLSNLYVDAETELMLAIRFAEWSLLSDHYRTTPRFTLRIRDLPSTSQFIVDRDGNPVGPKPTLQPLASAFGRLADWLDELPVQKRDTSSLPAATVASGRPFAFNHLSVFHDLTLESQSRVLTDLRNATRELGAEDVLTVRNTGPGHGNNPFPDDDQIRIAMTHLRRGLETLAVSGLTPIVYERVSMSSGLRGQREMLYGSKFGNSIIRVPSWPLAPGLPASSSHLVLLPSCTGPGWGQLRFSIPTGDRGGPRWDNWPPRRSSKEEADWDTSPDAVQIGSDSQAMTA
jgi:hypothetical protein